MSVSISPFDVSKRVITDLASVVNNATTTFPRGPAVTEARKTMPDEAEHGGAAQQGMSGAQEDPPHIEVPSPKVKRPMRETARQKRDGLLNRMMHDGSAWLTLSIVDQGRLVSLLRREDPRILDWLLRHEADPAFVQSHLVALIEASASRNKAFIEFVLRPGLGLERVSETKIRLCRECFEKWPEKLAVEIASAPHVLHTLDEKYWCMAYKFNTLSREMIAFVFEHAATVCKWSRAKIRRIREAFELDIPALTNYIKGHVHAWAVMQDAQMVQTIRAFRIGNESHLRQIIAGRPGKQWHLSAASVMQDINTSMEQDFGIGRFLARRNWSNGSR